MARRVEVFGIGLIVLLTSSSLVAQEDPWVELARIARGNYYNFALRDKTCLYGPLKAVSPESIEVDISPTAPSIGPQIVKVNRAEVVQVQGPTGILYSGRSSWADVQGVSAAIGLRESLCVALKSGRSVCGKPVAVTDAMLSLKGGGAKAIQKADVATVSYVRIKPISAGSAWFAQEAGLLALFDPHEWPYILGIGVHMRVLIYSSAMAEDDSSVECPKR